MTMRILRPLALLFATSAWGEDSPAEFFELNVRPVLAKNCFSCHTQSKMGGLEMISRNSLLKGGKSGAAIVTGKPEESLLMKAVTFEHERLKMPPNGAKLAADEIASLREWIKNGAVWPEGPSAAKYKEYVLRPEQKAYWAFQPVKAPQPPAVKNAAWPKTSIDRFILAKLEQSGISPNAPASRVALLRRVTYDLTGLPPTPQETDVFLADSSPAAYGKVVDRLLASKRYGERWGRFWLDIARYSDDKLNSTMEEPAPNAFRYRDWVVDAFNADMPYDTFVKAQLAADHMNDPKLLPALGMYGLSPEFQDDRVDVTTRGFLALTVACAQCHDHKFDPIPTKDYYSLLGIFNNSQYKEYPLAAKDVVAIYEAKKKHADDRDKSMKDFLQRQGDELASVLAHRAKDYVLAALGRGPKDGLNPAGLDDETLERWRKYVKRKEHEHPYLAKLAAAKDGDDFQKLTQEFEELVLAVNREKKEIDEKNNITLGGSQKRGDLSQANLASLERNKYFLWRDLYGPNGVLFYGDKKIDRFLSGEWKRHLDMMRANLELDKKAVPEKFPFLHALADKEKLSQQKIHVRGNPATLGDEAPAEFLTVLCDDNKPKPFSKGSGRLELAEAIAGKQNPLTARVMVNRLWQWHFGDGIVRTASNFGVLGERPSHPELLDYLAAKFMQSGWSIKTIHREILLSAVYQQGNADNPAFAAKDPDNRLLWKFNRRRLDAEALRDSMLYVAGMLDETSAGQAKPIDEGNHKRTLYGYISRKKLDNLLTLFDFPNPNQTSEQRVATNVPLQRLFLLNSPIMLNVAKEMTKRLEATPEPRRIDEAYRLLFNRSPKPAEKQLGDSYVARGADAWPEYLQVLLSSNEFLYVN